MISICSTFLIAICLPVAISRPSLAREKGQRCKQTCRTIRQVKEGDALTQIDIGISTLSHLCVLDVLALDAIVCDGCSLHRRCRRQHRWMRMRRYFCRSTLHQKALGETESECCQSILCLQRRLDIEQTWSHSRSMLGEGSRPSSSQSLLSSISCQRPSPS